MTEDPREVARENEREICVAIECLLRSATGRQPQGNIQDVLLRISEFLAEYFDQHLASDELEKLVATFWAVLISENNDLPLALKEGVFPSIDSQTTRLMFVSQYIAEFAALVPIPGQGPGIWTSNNSCHRAICHRFEEFLVSIVLFHATNDPGAWLSLPVALSKLFEFIDVLSISEQEPVCRDLLRAMTVVDEAVFRKVGSSQHGMNSLLRFFDLGIIEPPPGKKNLARN